MKKIKGFFSRQWEGILGNLIANVVWIMLGWIALVLYGFFSKKGWDFLGLEANVGVVIAMIAYLLMGMGISLALYSIYFFTFIRGRARVDEWSGIDINIWNPINSNVVKGGLEITNNSGRDIEDCYVELIEIYQRIDTNDGLGLYKESKTSLPTMLAWYVDNSILFEKIELEKTKRRCLALVYTVFYVDDIASSNIKAKNFAHPVGNGVDYILEIEVSGKVDKETLHPKKLFVYTSYTDNKFTIQRVTNEYPRD